MNEIGSSKSHWYDVNLKKTGFESERVKKLISRGYSLTKLVENLSHEKQKDGPLNIACKVHLLKEAIKGKNDYYENTIRGKIDHFFSSIFGSSIDKANKLNDQYKEIFKAKKENVVECFREFIPLVEKEDKNELLKIQEENDDTYKEEVLILNEIEIDKKNEILLNTLKKQEEALESCEKQIVRYKNKLEKVDSGINKAMELINIQIKEDKQITDLSYNTYLTFKKELFRDKKYIEFLLDNLEQINNPKSDYHPFARRIALCKFHFEQAPKIRDDFEETLNKYKEKVK